MEYCSRLLFVALITETPIPYFTHSRKFLDSRKALIRPVAKASLKGELRLKEEALETHLGHQTILRAPSRTQTRAIVLNPIKKIQDPVFGPLTTSVYKRFKEN